MQSVRVAAALIFNNGKFLIARRRAEDRLGGYWEFPGGKIEPGEAPEAAVIREIAEELSLQIDVGELFMTAYEDASERVLELSLYWATAETRTVELHAHDAVEWVSIPELQEYCVAPADVAVVKRLMRIDATDFDTIGRKA